MEYDKGMKCQRCGSRAVSSLHGEIKCFLCDWRPVPPLVELIPVTVAATRCEVAVRTVRRWIDAGKVIGDPPTGSGRVRLVDVVSVADYIAARLTTLRTCEKCGGEIEPSGVQRASRVNRRWCKPQCKNDYHNAAWDRRRAVA